MYALYCLVDVDFEEFNSRELFQDYIGQTMWMISNILHSKAELKNPLEQYLDMRHPENKKPDMTRKEIETHILEKIGFKG